MSKFEKSLLEHALAECDNIQTRTADRLGVNGNTVRKKLLKHELLRIDEADEHLPRHQEECDDD